MTAETRVYTFTGTVAHLLTGNDGANSHARALCGFSPAWHYEWHGTGSQAEYERAAALPTCKYCAKRLEESTEFYHSGGVLRPVTSDVPTGLCAVCGERYKLRRADGSVVMHTRKPRPGEVPQVPGSGLYWCDGGLPAGAR